MGADLSSVYAEDLTGSESLSTSGVDSDSWTAVQVVYHLSFDGCCYKYSIAHLGFGSCFLRALTVSARVGSFDQFTLTF